MKFKVGDKVKFVKSSINHYEGIKINSIWEIKNIKNLGKRYFAVNINKKSLGQFFTEEELEKLEYTYKDLDKLPVGTKVIDKYGNSYIKVYENHYKQISDKNEWFYLIDRYSKKSFLENINKIEVPEYKTYYDQKKEILDEVEKRYLSNFIRPFRDNVKYIKKTHYRYEKSKIEICVNGYIEEANISDTYYTFLPAFSTNEMYNGMTLEKEYTLEELGL